MAIVFCSAAVTAADSPSNECVLGPLKNPLNPNDPNCIHYKRTNNANAAQGNVNNEQMSVNAFAPQALTANPPLTSRGETYKLALDSLPPNPIAGSISCATAQMIVVGWQQTNIVTVDINTGAASLLTTIAGDVPNCFTSVGVDNNFPGKVFLQQDWCTPNPGSLWSLDVTAPNNPLVRVSAADSPGYPIKPTLPGNKKAYVGNCDNSLYMTDLETGAITELASNAGYCGTAIAPDGKTLYIGTPSSQMFTLDITADPIPAPTALSITGASFHPITMVFDREGKTLFMAAIEQSNNVWALDIATGVVSVFFAGGDNGLAGAYTVGLTNNGSPIIPSNSLLVADYQTKSMFAVCLEPPCVFGSTVTGGLESCPKTVYDGPSCAGATIEWY